MKKHYFQIFLLFCLTAALVSPAFADNLSDIGKAKPSFVSSTSSPLVTPSPNHFPVVTGTGTVTGCSYTAYSNSPVCVGGTISLSSSAPPQGAHRWKGPGNYSSNLAGPTIPATLARSGVYTLSVTYNACVATATVSVKVNSPITSLSAWSNSPSAQVSHGGTLNLSSSGSPGGGSYYWSGPGFSSGSQNPSRSPADANNHSGDYYVTYSIPGCPEWTASTSVSIKHTCTVTANSNGPVCGEGSYSYGGADTWIDLSASGTGSSTAGSTYRWKGPDNFSSSEQSPTIYDPQTSNSGIYTVTIRKNASQCTNTATVSVQVNTVSVSIVDYTNPVCKGGTIAITASGSGSPGATGEYYYYGPNRSNGWTTSNTVSFNNAQESDQGWYEVYFEKNECVKYTYAYIEIKPGIEASIVHPLTPFVGTPVQLSAQNEDGSPTSGLFYWDGPGGFSSNLQSPKVPKVNSSAYAYVAATVDGCESTDAVYIQTTTTLLVGATNTWLCAGGSFKLLSNMAPLGAHRWKGPAGSGYSSTLAEPTINNAKLTQSGVYSLSVTYNAMVYTATINISVVDCGNTRMATADDAPSIDMNINAYPNPVTNTLKVEVELKEAGPLSLQLFNSMGQPSGTWQLNNETTVHQTEIDMTSLQGGVYMLQAQSGKEKAVKRVVKIQY